MKKIIVLSVVSFLLLCFGSVIKAEALGYNTDVINTFFQGRIGTPSAYYVTLIYEAPQYPNGSTVVCFKFSSDFSISPKNFTYSGTLQGFCIGQFKDSSRNYQWQSQNISDWNRSNCNPDNYIIYGISGGNDTDSFSDTFEFKKSDNEMKMVLSLRAEFEKSRTYDWWCSTDLYAVTFDVNYNGTAYNIPIKFYPQFMPKIGTPTAQYDKTPVWLEEYFEGSNPSIKDFGKVFQDYPITSIKTYSGDYYRNSAFLYNRSDGTKMWLTAWNLGLVGEDETPLYAFPDDNNWFHYYYGNGYNMLPDSATTMKDSNGSAVSEFLEFYLSDIKAEMVSRVPDFTTNDLYKCTYTVKCYGKNKPDYIAYNKSLDWSEYVDTNIAPPIMEDSANKRNYFKDPSTQNLSDNGTESVRAPSPFVINQGQYIDGVTISDFDFYDFQPDGSDVSLFGGFFSIFTDSPFGIVLFLALTFLVIKTLIW